MPVGLAFKVGTVAAIAFVGLLGGEISTFAPATPGNTFGRILTLVAAAIAILKLGVAVAGLLMYRSEQTPPPAIEE